MGNDDTPIMIEDCLERESKLSDWEAGFIDSLESQLGAGNSLTQKQIDKLGQIWERIT